MTTNRKNISSDDSYILEESTLSEESTTSGESSFEEIESKKKTKSKFNSSKKHTQKKRKDSSGNNVKSNKKPQIQNNITKLDAVDTFLKLAVKCEESTPSKPTSLSKILYSKRHNKNWKETNTIAKYNNYFKANKLQLKLRKNDSGFYELIDKIDDEPIAILTEIDTSKYKLGLYKRCFELKGDKHAEKMEPEETVDFNDYAAETEMFKDNRDQYGLKSELNIFCNLADKCDKKYNFAQVLKVKILNFRYKEARIVTIYNTKFLMPHGLKLDGSSGTTQLYDTQVGKSIARMTPPARKLELSGHYFKLQEQPFPAHFAKEGWVFYRDIIDISRTPDKIKRIQTEINDFKIFIKQCAIRFADQIRTRGNIDSNIFISEISNYCSLEEYIDSFKESQKADLQISFRRNNVAVDNGFLYSLYDDLTNKTLIGLTRITFEVKELEENYLQLHNLEKEEFKSTEDNVSEAIKLASNLTNSPNECNDAEVSIISPSLPNPQGIEKDAEIASELSELDILSSKDEIMADENNMANPEFDEFDLEMMFPQEPNNVLPEKFIANEELPKIFNQEINHRPTFFYKTAKHPEILNPREKLEMEDTCWQETKIPKWLEPKW